MLVGILTDDYRRRRARLLGLPEDATDADVHTHTLSPSWQSSSGTVTLMPMRVSRSHQGLRQRGAWLTG
ncbi:hypothetical protein PKB_5483 [Pseudomonas knackmussii B13]|uniref:Uncharacterized protein n=1 Tax=Pseudomonas knackmussii (strain DSM 6978 / CCUG 54928 / LMG 23759 / B13) TaxID=1301098 RepID=A0A024HQL3_PSEKB|nr:hypothetical protein PKB_5483 [Pseudomonas knackmussii B13]